MEWQDGRIIGFECRFRSMDDDYERYTDALIKLNKDGKIPRKKGQRLIELADGGSDWIYDQYFEARRFDQIEKHCMGNVSFSMGPVSETTQACMTRLHAIGETVRVRRIWRQAIAYRKAGFWEQIRARDKGPDPSQHWSGDIKEAEADHARCLEWISHNKPYLVSTMKDYLDFLQDIEPNGREIDKLRLSLKDVETEIRQKPAGKNDNRTMSEDVFWELIEQGLPEATAGERLESLPDRLALFKPAAIRKFAEIFRDLDDAAYRTDVWALAYLLADGCSDDAFDDFRAWLILLGREVFHSTLADPDSFDFETHGAVFGATALRGVAEMAFDLREGRAMKPIKFKLREVIGPELEEAGFKDHLPNIAARLGRS